jgi:hypothetical protein
MTLLQTATGLQPRTTNQGDVAMPLPSPTANESRDDFVARCMKDPATQDITGTTPEEAQSRRVAACERQLDAKGGEGEFDIKSFGALEIKDAEQGEVTAIVATLGVVDKDGDVLLPGSFPASASVKMSAYSHDVVMDGAAPVGKGTITVQGDKAVFQGRFFMTTERGREAFHTVKELGADGEWSFGFPRHVQMQEMTADWKAKGARRIIAGIQPLEASPVFRGAGIGTGTLAAKAADTDQAPPAVDSATLAAEASAKAATVDVEQKMPRIRELLKRR